MNVFLIVIAVFLGISAIEFIIIMILSKMLGKKNQEIFRINKQTEIDKANFKKKLKASRLANEKSINDAGSIDELVNITHGILRNNKRHQN